MLLKKKYDYGDRYKGRYKGRYKEKKYAQTKIWKQDNRDKVHENYEKHKIKNRPKVLLRNKKFNLEQMINLTDSYIARLLSEGSLMTIKQIKKQPLLIEAKRAQIQLYRLSNK